MSFPALFFTTFFLNTILSISKQSDVLNNTKIKDDFKTNQNKLHWSINLPIHHKQGDRYQKKLKLDPNSHTNQFTKTNEAKNRKSNELFQIQTKNMKPLDTHLKFNNSLLTTNIDAKIKKRVLIDVRDGNNRKIIKDIESNKNEKDIINQSDEKEEPNKQNEKEEPTKQNEKEEPTKQNEKEEPNKQNEKEEPNKQNKKEEPNKQNEKEEPNKQNEKLANPKSQQKGDTKNAKKPINDDENHKNKKANETKDESKRDQNIENTQQEEELGKARPNNSVKNEKKHSINDKQEIKQNHKKHNNEQKEEIINEPSNENKPNNKNSKNRFNSKNEEELNKNDQKPHKNLSERENPNRVKSQREIEIEKRTKARMQAEKQHEIERQLQKKKENEMKARDKILERQKEEEKRRHERQNQNANNNHNNHPDQRPNNDNQKLQKEREMQNRIARDKERQAERELQRLNQIKKQKEIEFLKQRQHQNQNQNQNQNPASKYSGCSKNKIRDREGRCVCPPGFLEDSHGCFVCDVNCHSSAQCVFPGSCLCIPPFIGDGVNFCVDSTPKVAKIRPKSGKTTGGTTVNVTFSPFDINSLIKKFDKSGKTEKDYENDIKIGFCRFGSTIVRARSIDGRKSAVCVTPQHLAEDVLFSFSYNQIHWSKETVFFTFKDQGNLIDIILDHYLLIVPVVTIAFFVFYVKPTKESIKSQKNQDEEQKTVPAEEIGVEIAKHTSTEEINNSDGDQNDETQPFIPKKRNHME